MMDAPYKIQIDPERATELAQSGAIILLLDVPTGTVVGIDQQAYIVGPNFKGVKMVPPGAHFVSSNAVSSRYSAAAAGGGSDVAPTASFFVEVALREVVIRRWDRAEELLLPLDDVDEEARLAKAARSFAFDTSLAPYNLGTLQQWRSLSGHITRELIEKVAPVNGGNLSVTTEPDPFLKGPRTAAEEQLAAQLQSKAHVGSQAGQAGSGQAGAGSERSDLQAPEQAHLGSHTGQPAASSGQESAAPYQAGKSPVAGQPAESISRESRDSCTPEGAGSAAATNTRQPATQTQKGVGRCFYTPVPTRATGTDLSPEEVTRLNMDKSALLGQLIDSQYGGEAVMLLGELQFALLAFLLGHSLEAFGQWKALLRLLLSCEEAPFRTHSSFYAQALDAVHAQLSHCLANSRDTQEEASPLQLGMTTELLADSFLRTLFTRFYHTLQLHSPISHKGLQAAARQLQELLERELGWDMTASDLQGDTSDEDAPVVVEL